VPLVEVVTKKIGVLGVLMREVSFEGIGVFHEVVDGQIVLPERYMNVEAADLAEDEMDADDEGDEEDDGTSKKTITPEDDD
jgi:hypothetical protein